ncbi:MAG TPA: Asp-tRNA(Asn)/Glu-tRNA(Gln) amidotransferase subunit GatB [Candidatus Gastranaerophilales bacterium]|nr:Asp-tRNA(Asn)/Glu-tRNA(Gln) amidotransferase subunit GatB [Candidatus Gastranaerophilales bacterium]
MTTKIKYETVIGLEVHAQVKTKSKIFCNSATEFGQEHNSQVCPVCLGYPGTLPVLNRKVVEYAILAGLALNCEIAKHSKFDRKHYFYPDLPKNIQISQYDMPICKNGHIMINGKKIRINRIHMEEDAGKLVHAGSAGISGASYSLVDYNRTGVPLLEIVSEADISSPEEARFYVEKLRNIVKYLDVCDGNLEEGSLRCDANVSIRPFGQKELGTKVEIKNLNSFKALQRSLEYEVDRQIYEIENGGKIIQETRLWKDDQGITLSMRTKEESHDYRYFPEPDLPILEIDAEWVHKIRETLPELPDEKRLRYIEKTGLSEYDASVIVDSIETAKFFDDALKLTNNAKSAANWLMGDITAYLKENKLNLNDIKLTPESLVEMIDLIDKGTISNAIAKKIIVSLMEKGGSAQKIVEEQGLTVISDEGQILEAVKKVIKENPGEVEKYKSGKTQVIGFFVGQIMKETKGKANPAVINKLFKEEMEK